jgi:hypothetical protein
MIGALCLLLRACRCHGLVGLTLLLAAAPALLACACCCCSPDLSCLQHHSCLRSLAIEAAGMGWQLSSLQLGHLVHIGSLRQLSLASRGGAGYLPAHALAHAQAHAHVHMHPHGHGQLGGHVSPGRSHPRLISPGGSSSGGYSR